MSRAFINSIHYTLGECRRSYMDVPTFDYITNRYSIPNLPDLFGWGDYYTTESSIEDLAIDAAARTLQSCNVSPDDVDVVLICSVNFHQAGGRLYQRVLTTLGLTRAFPVGVTLNDCTMLLSAVEMAHGLIMNGYNHILVISVNRVEDENFRFLSYALFSDGAVSCLVSRDWDTGCEVLGCELMSGIRSGSAGDGSDDMSLYLAAQNRFTNKLKITLTEVDQVFCNNVFAPVVKIKEGRLGITESQLFLENIPRIGHCFSADPFINLADYWSTGRLRDGSVLMLTSDADGLRAQTGLRYHA